MSELLASDEVELDLSPHFSVKPSCEAYILSRLIIEGEFGHDGILSLFSEYSPVIKLMLANLCVEKLFGIEEVTRINF